MRLDQVEILEAEPGRGQRLLPGERRPSKARMSRRLIGRKSLTCSAARNATAFFIDSAVCISASTTAAAPSDTSEQSIRFSGRRRAVLVGDSAAEFVAEIAAHLGHRVGDAVLVVLRGDPRQRIGLVAVALEIFLGDLAEDAGEAALDLVSSLR